MRRNQAPLFFLIVITGILVAAALFIKNDINSISAGSASTAQTVPSAGADSMAGAKPETAMPREQAAVPQEIIKEEKTAEPVEEEKPLEFETVTEDYFNDALFIGDSRTVGLRKYTQLGEASFFAETGMSIHNIFDKKLLEPTISEEKKSLEEVLTENTYGKIYLMVGINELGRGTADTYFTAYKTVLDRIRQLQPEAVFFIEGNMNVAKEKSDNDPIFNNINIGIRNGKIASLADGINTFYLDINEVITDDEGYLISEYTFDNVHLKAKYYSIWKDFLLSHGIVKD